MMETRIHRFTIVLFILIVECNALFYFNSYHYPIDDLNQIKDIKIEWINSSFIINHDIQLNWNEDHHWNEVSYIYNNDNAINSKKDRRMLDDEYREWNKWDHTTEHHKKEGRFIGESKYKRKYTDASSMCHEFYAELASIRDISENTEVKALCNQLGEGSCWIGLKKEGTTDWNSIKKWLDGHPLGYTNWASGEPNDKVGKENCVEMYNNGLWNDIPCDRERYTICEQVTEHRIGEYVGIHKKTSWFKANLYCKMKYGSELATITSLWQQQDAQESCGSRIAGFDAQDCWIGFKKAYDVLWQWTGNHDIVEFTNWGLQQPKDNADKKCACLNAHSTAGVWQNEECDQKKWIICNAKEQTPQTFMRDMLFPPSYREQQEKQKRIEKEQETEIAEKKAEQEFAEMKQETAQEHAQKTGEDIAELSNDNMDGTSIGMIQQTHHISHPMDIRNSEGRAELKMDSYHTHPHTHTVDMRNSEVEQELKQDRRPQIQRMSHQMDQLKELNALHSGSMPNNDNLMKMLQTLLRSLSRQPGQGNINNMAQRNYFDHGVDLSSYNPQKDPYFGKMNMRHSTHKPSGYLQHGGSLHPPSGDVSNPYGFNPQFYPHTQLPAPYASAARTVYYEDGIRRRLMFGIGYDEMEKCRFGVGFVLCVRDDVKDNKMTLEVMIPDKKQLKDKKEVYGDIVKYVDYFETFEFLFEFNPYLWSHRLCHNDDNEILLFRVCLEKEIKKGNKYSDIRLRLLDDKKLNKMFSFVNNNEWDEIYRNINKKCLYLMNAKICMMPIVEFDDYMVQIKVYNTSTKA